MIKVSQKLQEERLRKRLSIDDVAKATKIKAAFLDALERGEYTKLPSSAYAKGFIKNYSIFLGLPAKEMLALFRREFDEKKTYSVLPEGFSREQPVFSKRMPVQQAAFVGGLFFLTLLLYIAFQYKFVFFNPTLSVLSPKENQVFTQPEIVVSGSADSNATVYINKTPVPLDENGKFKKTISVFPGKETITIKAVSRFGKENVIDRHIQVTD